MTSKESARREADRRAAGILRAIDEARYDREDYEASHVAEDIALIGLASLVSDHPDYENLQSVALKVMAWLNEREDDPRWYA